jgi:hypothetical protein
VCARRREVAEISSSRIFIGQIKGSLILGSGLAAACRHMLVETSGSWLRAVPGCWCRFLRSLTADCPSWDGSIPAAATDTDGGLGAAPRAAASRQAYRSQPGAGRAGGAARPRPAGAGPAAASHAAAATFVPCRWPWSRWRDGELQGAAGHPLLRGSTSRSGPTLKPSPWRERGDSRDDYSCTCLEP